MRCRTVSTEVTAMWNEGIREQQRGILDARNILLGAMAAFECSCDAYGKVCRAFAYLGAVFDHISDEVTP